MREVRHRDASGSYSNQEDFDRLESGVRRRNRAALAPVAFRAKRTDGGVQFTIIDRDPITEGNGAVRYDIYWAEDVDLTDEDTIAAGYARSTNVMSIPAPGREGADATRMLFGERYLRGFYFCVGVDAANERGEPTPPLSLNDESNSGGYPDDVTHPSVSESGEVHNGVPYSVLSFIYQAPIDDRFAGVMFFIKDYPVINEIYQTHFHRYTGQRGGTGQDKFKLEIGRRKGTGDLTIALAAVSGASTAFLAEMNAGDLIEARGHTQEIDSITDDDTATLAANWAGDTVTTLADWWVIPEITIYFVSVGKDGRYREDIESAPSVTVYLDGLLSAPVAPVLTANKDANDISTIGEVIRLEWAQLEGTEIKAYHLYRGKGAAVAFSSCTPIITIPHNPHALTGGNQSYDDDDFTYLEKEENQVWSYYLVAENWREQRSDESARLEVACRLTKADGVDPSVPARSGVLNYLYNAALIADTGNNVDDADATQDSFNNIGGPPAGWKRWEGTAIGGGAVVPTHQNIDQIHFTAPGAGNSTFAYQEIKAWSDATADPRVIRRHQILTFQALIRHGGVLPNGNFYMYIETYNLAVFNEYSKRRYRNSSDALAWIAAGTGARIEISGADLLSDWQMFMGVFLPDATLTATKIRVTWGWEGGTTGTIHVTQPMLSFGEELCNWTGQMVETALDWSPGNDAGMELGDGFGVRHQDVMMP